MYITNGRDNRKTGEQQISLRWWDSALSDTVMHFNQAQLFCQELPAKFLALVLAWSTGVNILHGDLFQIQPSILPKQIYNITFTFATFPPYEIKMLGNTRTSYTSCHLLTNTNTRTSYTSCHLL